MVRPLFAKQAVVEQSVCQFESGLFRHICGYGKSAGPIRNARMAAIATHAIVFWDGVSRGSLSMINEAKSKKLYLKVIYI